MNEKQLAFIDEMLQHIKAHGSFTEYTFDDTWTNRMRELFKLGNVGSFGGLEGEEIKNIQYAISTLKKAGYYAKVVEWDDDDKTVYGLHYRGPSRRKPLTGRVVNID